jgi:hypothetical protein
VSEQVSPFVEAVSERTCACRRNDAPSLHVGAVHAVGRRLADWRLQVTSFDVDDAVHAAVESHGHEATGDFWQDVADRLVYDPEADMFEAIGDRASLLRLSAVMHPVVTDPAAVGGVIDAATAAGVEFA